MRPKVGHHIALPQNSDAEIDEAVSEYWRRRRESARVVETVEVREAPLEEQRGGVE